MHEYARSLEYLKVESSGVEGHGIKATLKNDPDDAHADPNEVCTIICVTPVSITIDTCRGNTILHSLDFTFEQWSQLSELLNNATNYAVTKVTTKKVGSTDNA